jgi:GTP pyrophosphokinase
MVAKRIVTLLAEGGEKPDAMVMSRRALHRHESVSQGALLLDGSEAVLCNLRCVAGRFRATGSRIWLGVKGLLCIPKDAQSPNFRLQNRDSERFISVDWSDEPRGCLKLICW